MTNRIRLGGFELLAPLAQGGMGDVWSGRHVRADIRVAVKVITEGRAKNRYFHQVFMDEARMVAGLDHPGIVRVLDFGEVSSEAAAMSEGQLIAGSPYIVQEFAGGGSLQASRKRVMAWPELRAVLLGLLDALSHAHARGIIHRDLKPANILVCGMEDSRPGLKLCDFGLGRLFQEYAQTGTIERVRGTLHYMAPEQCTGLWRDQGPWTDLYALGVMAYALAAGRLPFEGKKGKELMLSHVQAEPPVLPNRRGIPPGYATWVYRLMEKSPWLRFRCAADAAWALRALPTPNEVGPREWVLPELAVALGLTDTLTGSPPSLASHLEPETLDISDVVTVMSGKAVTGGEVANEDRMLNLAPPMPGTWRIPRVPGATMQLVDAGATLYGLRPVPMVGRESERDELWSVLSDVHRDGMPRIVFITGAAGAGASRLSEWIACRADELGAAKTLTFSHTEEDPPWAAVREGLERSLKTRRLTKAELRARVSELFMRMGRQGDSDIEALTRLLSGSQPERSVARQELCALVCRFFLVYSWDRPLIVRVENLQWGREVMAVLQLLMEADGKGRCPVLVLVTRQDRSRPDESGSFWAPGWLLGDPNFHEVIVGPLSPSERSELVQELLFLDSKLSLLVEQQCKGNPAYAVALVGGWIRDGLLEVSEDGYRLREGVELVLPDSLHAVWNTHVSALLESMSPEVAIYLERAAVLGDRVKGDRWSMACPTADVGVLHGLREALIGRGLAEIAEQDWRFSHPLLRESLLRRASEHGRMESHHRACVEVFLSLAEGEEGSGDAERLGQHLMALGRSEEALECWLKAADEYWRAYAHGQCLFMVARCEELLERLHSDPLDDRRGQLLELRVHCHFQRGEYSQADKWLEKSLVYARALNEPLREANVLLDAVDYAVARGLGEQADERMRSIRSIMEGRKRGPVGLKWTLVEANLAIRSNQLEDGLRWSRDSEDLARSLGDDHALGQALRDQATIASIGGDYPLARETYVEARQVQEQHGGLKNLANTINRQGECERWAGEVEKAETYYRESVAIYDRAGASHSAHLPLINLALLYTGTGRLTETMVPLTRALGMVQRQGNEGFEIIIRLLLLASCATLADWAGWNVQIEKAGTIYSHVSLVEKDLAESVHHAANLAHRAGRRVEAKQAYDLCEWMYGLLQDGEAIAVVQEQRTSLQPNDNSEVADE